MSISKAERNKAAFRLLLEDAMPNARFDVIRDLVAKECVTERAGFANLYNALGDAIPERGNFLEWCESGWKPLQEALSNQHVEIKEIVGDENTVMMKFHMQVTHNGTFVGAPATGNRVEWDEIGIAKFNDDGKMTTLWFMCEELKLAVQIGYGLTLN